MLSKDPDQLKALDEALWTFSDQDFLPHVMANDKLATRTPVVLSESDTVEFPHYEILVNLSPDTPAQFARFERMFEVISMSEDDRTAGRERYRYYQQRGYPLTHFVAEKA